MAGSSNVQYPTADRLEDCPATPAKPITPPLKADLEKTLIGSPLAERICAICLEKTQENCLTDSCPHQFCFPCLHKWCKIKSECPLCKKSIKKIKYNIKSDDKYDEYIVHPPNPSSPPYPIQIDLSTSQIPSAPRPRLSHLLDEFDAAFDAHSHAMEGGSHRPQVAHRLNFLLSEPQRYTYRTTLHLGRHQNEAIQQLFLRSSALTEQYGNRYPYDNIPFRQQTHAWRRYVYDRNLYALPLPDITGRFRECNSNFYRENPAQVHRLLAWINRELVSILPPSDSTQNALRTIMENMTDLLTIYNIDSYEFRIYMQPHLREKTDHFVHELMNFAKSPYDLLGYDRNVEYQPQFDVEEETPRNSQVHEISSGSEGEDVVIAELPSVPQLELLDLLSNAENNGNTEEPDINNLSGEVEVQETPQPGTSGLNQNQTNQSDSQPVYCLDKDGKIARTKDIVVSSDNDSDVEFVLARKPPHLRTPEMVSLNSESDSDVIFVDDSVNKLPVVLDSESDSSDDIPLAKLKTEIKPPENEENRREHSGQFSLIQELVTEPVPEALNEIEVPSGSSGLPEPKCPRKKFYNRSIKQMYHENSSSTSSSSSSSSSASTTSSSSDCSSDSDFEIGKRKNVQKKSCPKFKKAKMEKSVDYRKAYESLKKRIKKLKRHSHKRDLPAGSSGLVNEEAGSSKTNAGNL